MAALPQSLAEWRDREGIGLDQLARALRVEAGTLERIEAGEVAPGNQLRERIGKVIERGFDYRNVASLEASRRPDDCAAGVCYSCSSDEFPLAAPLLPGPALEGEGAAADGEPAAASDDDGRMICDAWLARAGEGFGVQVLMDSHQTYPLTIDEARALAAKLAQLVAAHDAGPSGFAAAFP